MNMLELCNHIYENYPNMKKMFPRWRLLSLLDKNEDKVFYFKENGKFICAALYVKLTDKTFAKMDLGFVNMRNSEEVQELLKENGKNIHVIYVLANGMKSIRKGIRKVIEKENPKTFSWYEPDMSRLHIYKIKGELCHKL